MRNSWRVQPNEAVTEIVHKFEFVFSVLKTRYLRLSYTKDILFDDKPFFFDYCNGVNKILNTKRNAFRNCAFKSFILRFRCDPIFKDDFFVVVPPWFDRADCMTSYLGVKERKKKQSKQKHRNIFHTKEFNFFLQQRVALGFNTTLNTDDHCELINDFIWMFIERSLGCSSSESKQ